MIVVLMLLAGGAGASSRLAVDGAIKSRLGDAFPWATTLVNVTGSLLLGLITGLVLHHGVSADLRTVLGTGFCGGYTTFSTSAFETARFVERGSSALAFVYAAGSVVLTVSAGALGLIVTQ